MTYPINNLSIQEFRGIERLDVPHFERINLICGPRNCKTTVLDAVRVLLVRGRRSTLARISHTPDMWDLFYQDSAEMVGNSPKPKTLGKQFEITANTDTDKPSSLKVTCVAAESHVDGDGYLHAIEAEQHDLSIAALRIEGGGRKRVVPVQIPADTYASDNPQPLCSVVVFNANDDHALAGMWTEDLALTDAKDKVLELLWLADTAISDLAQVADKESENLYFKLRGHLPFPVPLDTYGYTVRKLLALGLSLHAAKNGVLLIDNFEHDVGTTILPTVWKGVQLLAREWNVQVFATTRSHECRKAFDRVTDGVRKDFTAEDRIRRRLFVRCSE